MGFRQPSVRISPLRATSLPELARVAVSYGRGCYVVARDRGTARLALDPAHVRLAPHEPAADQQAGAARAARLLAKRGRGRRAWQRHSRVASAIPGYAEGAHGLHNWWYGCLQRAGVVAEGVTSGERMHKARHTAGQRVLDATGNLKAVQKLLGHESIQTTGDIYTDWDVEQLADSLMEAVQDD